MGYKFNPFTGTFDDSPSTLKGDVAYTTVQSNSAQWAIDSSSDTEVRMLTGTWNDVSTIVQTNSALWAVDTFNTATSASEFLARVANADSVNLERGDVVYTYGSLGDTMSVKKASNVSDTTSARTLGFVNETIIPNGYGYVTLGGSLDKLHLGSYTEGDILWLGTTPGTVTNVRPTQPYHGVYLGVVERANNGNGIAYVKVQNGQELDEIHDVLITSPLSGQTLRRNGANTLWVNTNDSFNWDSAYTTVQANSALWAIDNTGSSTKNTKIVGVHSNTIQGCIDSVTDATFDNQYFVIVPPGEYAESLTFKPCVNLASVASNTGYSLITKIKGFHTYSGTSSVRDNYLQITGVLLSDGGGATAGYTPVLSLSSNYGNSALIHLYECVISNTSTSLSSVVVYTGPNVVLRAKNVTTTGCTTSGLGGVHWNVDRSQVYLTNCETEYGFSVFKIQGSVAGVSLLPYLEARNNLFKCCGTTLMTITSTASSALVTMGFNSFENTDPNGSAIDFQSNGATVGAFSNAFVIKPGANNYIATTTTNVTSAYFFHLGNSYSNSFGASYANSIHPNITQIQYEGSGTTVVQVITATGSTTWLKPYGAKSVKVQLIGGGGGGGGGGKQASGTAATGGAGGAGGGYTDCEVSAGELPAFVTVTVGTGGTGGTGATGNANAGLVAGTAGGSTSFGSYFRASGGGVGTGASSSASTAGIYNGNAGGAGGTGGATNGSTGTNTGRGGIGGGGGGGVNASNTVSNGGAGGSGSAGLLSGGTGGAGSSSGSGTNGGTGNANNLRAFFNASAAGGGGASSSTTGGNGGSALGYGNGGGGGGATTGTGSGGNGGNGSPGLAIITTYF